MLLGIFQRSIEETKYVEEYESGSPHDHEKTETDDHRKNYEHDIHAGHVITRVFLGTNHSNFYSDFKRSLQ